MQRLLLIVGASLTLAEEVTPVQKVLQLLDNMYQKGEKELNEEQVQFAKFSQFCDATLGEKSKAIAKNTDQMELEEAEIAQAKSEVKRLANEIQIHTDDMVKSKTKQAEATEIRTTERTDFQTTLTDYTESIDAIGRALKALKEDAAKKVSLLQLAKVRRFLPKESQGEMDAYLTTLAAEKTEEPPLPSSALLEESAEASQAPKPKTYESQTGGVVKMLESLQDKFVDERNELETEEASQKHAFELLMQKLKALEAQNKKDKEEKTGFKAKQEQKQADSEAEFEDASTDRADDQKYHDDLKKTCGKKSSDFEERQILRKEELEALDKARDIIGGGSVAGSADKHLPSLLQKSSALAFLRSESHESPAQDQVAQFLQNAATKLGSRMLSAAAVRVGADPIAKVKKMVEDLITKLNEQNKAEADKEAWCDTEVATNKATREDKAETTESLQSEMDGLKSSIVKLGDEVVTLGKEVSELNTAMKEATELRHKENKKNQATMKDAKEAQVAVAKAIQVLNKFYTKAGEATSFVQRSGVGVKHSEQPEVFGDEPYKGMGGEGGGVVSMLEVIESDFARLLAETTAAEEAAQTEYDEFMLDSKQNKAEKDAAMTHKKDKSATQTEELDTTEADFLGTQKELDAAMEYFTKLKADCLDTGKSFAEKQAQRKEEVADLKDALEMLEKV